ncbi:MAG TPA: hypothetical protein VIE66_10310 [Methylocella sp.]|jgi:hypothetical protein
MATKPNSDTSNLSAAKTLISDAEDLVRLIDIAAAGDDDFKSTTIHNVARQAWEKMIAAWELLNEEECGETTSAG